MKTYRKRVAFANSPADEPTNTTGYSPQPDFDGTSGYELVQTLPKGFSYFIMTTAVGGIELWRLAEPRFDLGVLGPEAIAARPPGKVAQAPRANPPGRVVGQGLDRAAPGIVAGRAAAAQARSTADQLRAINEKNRAFWQGQR